MKGGGGDFCLSFFFCRFLSPTSTLPLQPRLPMLRISRLILHLLVHLELYLTTSSPVCVPTSCILWFTCTCQQSSRSAPSTSTQVYTLVWASGFLGYNCFTHFENMCLEVVSVCGTWCMLVDACLRSRKRGHDQVPHPLPSILRRIRVHSWGTVSLLQCLFDLPVISWTSTSPVRWGSRWFVYGNVLPTYLRNVCEQSNFDLLKLLSAVLYSLINSLSFSLTFHKVSSSSCLTAPSLFSLSTHRHSTNLRVECEDCGLHGKLLGPKYLWWYRTCVHEQQLTITGGSALYILIEHRISALSSSSTSVTHEKRSQAYPLQKSTVLKVKRLTTKATRAIGCLYVGDSNSPVAHALHDVKVFFLYFSPTVSSEPYQKKSWSCSPFRSKSARLFVRMRNIGLHEVINFFVYFSDTLSSEPDRRIMELAISMKDRKSIQENKICHRRIVSQV